MRIEVYIPDHEKEVIEKVHGLKNKRRLSNHIVDLLRNEDSQMSKDQIIDLIKQYIPEHKNTTNTGGIEESIKSIWDVFKS